MNINFDRGRLLSSIINTIGSWKLPITLMYHTHTLDSAFQENKKIRVGRPLWQKKGCLVEVDNISQELISTFLWGQSCVKHLDLFGFLRIFWETPGILRDQLGHRLVFQSLIENCCKNHFWQWRLYCVRASRAITWHYTDDLLFVSEGLHMAWLELTIPMVYFTRICASIQRSHKRL